MNVEKDFDRKNAVCPKCGFRATFRENWKMDFADNCVSASCPWNDESVSDHLHVSCPECNYEVVTQCADYDEQAGNQWNTDEEITKTGLENTIVPEPTITPQFHSPVPSFTRTNSFAHNLPTPIPPSDPWSTECPDCPCSKKDVVTL